MSKPIEWSSPTREPNTVEGHPTREEIEARAYEIYIERGAAPGRDVDDWLKQNLNCPRRKRSPTGSRKRRWHKSTVSRRHFGFTLVDDYRRASLRTRH